MKIKILIVLIAAALFCTACQSSDERKLKKKLKNLAQDTVYAMQNEDTKTIVENIDMELFYYEAYGEQGSTEEMVKLLTDESSESTGISRFSLPRDYVYIFNNPVKLKDDDSFWLAFDKDFAKEQGYDDVLEEFTVSEAYKAPFVIYSENSSVRGELYIINLNEEWKVDMFFTMYSNVYSETKEQEETER